MEHLCLAPFVTSIKTVTHEHRAAGTVSFPVCVNADQVVAPQIGDVWKALPAVRSASDRCMATGLSPGGTHGLELETGIGSHNSIRLCERVRTDGIRVAPAIAADREIVHSSAARRLFDANPIDR